MPESKISFYYAMSVDGYIADAGGSVDWLLPFQTMDYGFPSFLASLDTVIYGRKTYEFEVSAGEWMHAGQRRAIVVSSSLPSVSTPETELYRGNVPALVERLRSEGARAWVVGGGQLMGGFLNSGGVDAIHVHVIPIVLGAGVPAWPASTKGHALSLDATKTYPNAVVYLGYSARS